MGTGVSARRKALAHGQRIGARSSIFPDLLTSLAVIATK